MEKMISQEFLARDILAFIAGIVKYLLHHTFPPPMPTVIIL